MKVIFLSLVFFVPFQFSHRIIRQVIVYLLNIHHFIASNLFVRSFDDYSYDNSPKSGPIVLAEHKSSNFILIWIEKSRRRVITYYNKMGPLDKRNQPREHYK